jgi:signal transduction histidine kinase
MPRPGLNKSLLQGAAFNASTMKAVKGYADLDIRFSTRSLLIEMKQTRFINILRLVVFFAALSFGHVYAQSSATSSPSVAEVKTVQNPPTDSRTSQFTIKAFGRTLRLSIKIGTLGIAVIITLAVLLLVALRFAMVARWSSKQMAATNEKLQGEISQRSKAEEKIKSLNAELEFRVTQRTAQLQAANDELEAFSYSVSHDLRAPLRHIDGFSQMMVEDYSDRLDEDAVVYLNEIRSATQEMSQLIDDMLLLSSVARSEMHREMIDLSKLAEEVMSGLKATAKSRKAIIEIEEGLLAWGDKRLLQIMLSNLLGNAWKFTSKVEQAVISFGREQKDGETAFVVRDNGAGFDMSYSNKLFQAFRRLHRATEFEGTGIGLATVQRVVLRHGGRVWAEGEVGSGATFYFTVMDSAVNTYERQSNPAG